MENEIAEIKRQLHRQKILLRWSMAGWVALVSALTMGAAYQQVTFFKNIQVNRLALVDATESSG